MSGVNVPLLRKAVEWAEAEAAKPAELCEWAQLAWFIPASLDDPNVVVPSWWDEEFLNEYRTGKSAECGTCYCIAGYTVAASGEVVGEQSVQLTAAALLGIDDVDAEALFAGGNTIEDVRRIAEDIAGERL